MDVQLYVGKMTLRAVATYRVAWERVMGDKESGLPIIELGIVPEYFIDDITHVQIVGGNFWTTFHRLLVPCGMSGLARVPQVRIGRALDVYKRNKLGEMIDAARLGTRAGVIGGSFEPWGCRH